MDRLIRTALRRAVSEAGSQSGAAQRLGVTRSYMHDLLKGRRRPGPRVLRRLGIRHIRKDRYEPLERTA